MSIITNLLQKNVLIINIIRPHRNLYFDIRLEKKTISKCWLYSYVFDDPVVWRGNETI